MAGQNLNGNKRANDQFKVVASGSILPTGAAGSEQAFFNMPALGVLPGDFMIIFSAYDGGNHSSSGAVSGGGAGWTSDSIVWMYDAANFASKTLDAADCAATALSFRTRTATHVSYVILRNVVGFGPLTGTLKQKLNVPDQGAVTSMAFAGYTKHPNSKGHVMLVCDRDTTSSWNAPALHNRYNAFALTTWSMATADLRNPDDYKSGTPLIWTIGGVQLYGQTGILFEIS